MLFPSPDAQMHIYHASCASQLFYFMTVIKIYSKLEDLTAIFEHITATQQNYVLKISLTALEKKKTKA